jgi:hypothetical protein
MITKKGWQQELMMSLYKKEATYDAAVTINASNFCTLKGFSDYDPDWADEVSDDLETVSGSEYATEQEIIKQGFSLTYEEPKARPNTIIGMIAGAFGSLTPTQDGGFTAYKHKGNPVTVGTGLPSFNLIGKKGGIQYLQKGCMVNSVELSGEEAGPVKLSAEIFGSGTRATDATSFVAKVSEPRLYAKDSKLWLEDGASISIDATLTQGLENISSGTPTSLGPRVKSWRWKFMNNLEGQGGFGGGGVFQDMDYGRRAVELAMTLRFNDTTELDYYLNQTNLALELDCKTTTLVAAGGSFYYGFQLVVPSFKLKKAPMPKGGVGDVLTQDFEIIILDNGTNPISIFEGYSAKAAYFAA